MVTQHQPKVGRGQCPKYVIPDFVCCITFTSKDFSSTIYILSDTNCLLPSIKLAMVQNVLNAEFVARRIRKSD